jgi:hypothetical protein
VNEHVLAALTEPLTKLYTQFLWVNLMTIQIEPESKKALVLALAQVLHAVHDALEGMDWAESLSLEELQHLHGVTKEVIDIHAEGRRVLGEADRIVRERNLRAGRPEAPPSMERWDRPEQSGAE